MFIPHPEFFPSQIPVPGVKKHLKAPDPGSATLFSVPAGTGSGTVIFEFLILMGFHTTLKIESLTSTKQQANSRVPVLSTGIP
jgi:hypothetical protein